MEEKGCIGIPRALMFYRFFPFWKTFFEELGWRVKTSEGLRQKEKIVYFEDSCFPMKLLVTHAVQLKEEVDHLFIPRLVSIHRTYIMCPKFRGAPDIVRLATERKISIIDDTIDLQKRGASLFQSFSEIGKKLGASKQESRKAFRVAEDSFSRFRKGWMDRINRLSTGQLFEMDIPTPETDRYTQKVFPPLAGGDEEEGVKGGGGSIEASSHVTEKPTACVYKNESSRLHVALIGHPYNLFDIDISKDLLSLAKSLGMEVVTADLLSEKEIDHEVSDLSKEIYWSSGREIVGSLFHFMSGGVDGVIFLTSLKCGIDALLQEFIKRRLKVRGGPPVPLLILSLDEHTGREGLMTRLEAFMDVMEERKHQSPSTKFQISSN